MREIPPEDEKPKPQGFTSKPRPTSKPDPKPKPKPKPRADERPRHSEERERRQARSAMRARNRAREGTDKMSDNSSCGCIILTLFLIGVLVAILI